MCFKVFHVLFTTVVCSTAQEELIVQLNRLPVRLHTLRAQNQRRQLDEELDKIERLIFAFSKPKVFIELPPDQG
jgi:hypothetical protein